MAAKNSKRRKESRGCMRMTLVSLNPMPCLALAWLILISTGCGQERPVTFAVNNEDSQKPRVTLVAQAAQAAPAAAPGVSFAFPADGTGALLAQVLSPPRQLPLAHLADQDGPRDWLTAPTQNALPQNAIDQNTLAASAAARQLFPLAAADVPLATRLLNKDQGTARRLHRAVDAPPLHLAVEPALPSRTWLPYGNLSIAARPQGEAVPPLVVHPRPWELTVTAATNPSVREAFAEVVKLLPPVAATPAPPLTLAVSDPFSQARQSRLLNSPADNDPPAGSASTLPRPKLALEATVETK